MNPLVMALRARLGGAGGMPGMAPQMGGAMRPPQMPGAGGPSPALLAILKRKRAGTVGGRVGAPAMPGMRPPGM